MEEFLSVCDGIGAAQEAWSPLGWRPVLLSEIDPFPRAVLAQRHGALEVNQWLRQRAPDTTPLWGDFTALRARHFARFGIRIPSALVGGTPCQAFSVAGLRNSLADDRGNLTLQFVKLANAIDNLRAARGLPPLVIVWENVPGVLSTKDNAFGCFLGAMVGADAPLVPGRKQKWTDSGLVAGPRRKAAWRILDAQYFGLAQRRRRVFVVTSARDGFDPGAVLFEPEGVCRDTPPRRETGPGVARSIGASTGGASAKEQQHTFVGGDGAPLNALEGPAGTLAGGGRSAGGYSYDDVPLVPVALAYGGNNRSGPIDVAASLSANKTGSGQFYDFTVETFVVEPVECVTGDITHTLKAEGFDASEDGTGRGVPIIPANRIGEAFPINPNALRGDGAARTPSPDAEGRVRLRDPGLGLGAAGDPADTITAAGPGAVAYSIMPQNSGRDFKAREADVSQPLMADGPVRGNQGGDYVVQPVAYSISPGSGSEGPPSAVLTDVAPALTAEGEANKNGRGLHIIEPTAIGFSSKDFGQDAEYELAPTLRASGHADSHANGGSPPAVAFVQNSRSEVRLVSGDGQIVGALAADAGAQQQNYLAFALRGREEGAVPEIEGEGDTIGTLRAAGGGSSRDYVAAFNFEHGLAPHGSLAPSDTVPSLTESEIKGHTAVQINAAVRRLIPVECERLQGFRDNYTLVHYRNGLASDGPRYKALGNSMAVPCMEWIGRRLDDHLTFIGPHKPVPPQHDEHFWAWLREEGLI